MDSSGTLYRLIEEVNRKRAKGTGTTMSKEDREKAIAILLADPPKPIRNASIERFRRVIKSRLNRIFHR